MSSIFPGREYGEGRSSSEIIGLVNACKRVKRPCERIIHGDDDGGHERTIASDAGT